MTVESIATRVHNPVNSYPLTNEPVFMPHNYDLSETVKTLVHGGLILYPTDTIWGIGCDATNEAAVRKVYELKKRDFNKSFVILAASIDMIKQYVEHLHPRLETLLTYHRRPLTVVYDKAKNLPPNVTAPDGSIAIRIPHDGLCRQLINDFGKPLVATSANISSEPFPGHFGEISSEVIQGVDHVVKYQQHNKQAGTPSVIVKLGDPIKGDIIFLRE